MFSELLLGVIGLSCGLMVSCGVFTVFTAVGIVPRFADKTKTADHVRRYEDSIILGAFLGMLVSVYRPFFLRLRIQYLPNINAAPLLTRMMLILYGLFTGAYIGCVALSIAETFDAIPIMMNRTKLKKGLGFIILSLAIGKLLGGLFFCMKLKPLS